MQFSQVIGQKDLKTQLTQLVQHNRLSHALLFLGKEGSGALSLARAFAQYTVCEKVNGKTTISDRPQITEPSLFGEIEPIQTPELPTIKHQLLADSCGECAACKKAALLIHPDIHFCYPVIPRKSGDKPISTDYITEWRDFIIKNPYGNSYDWLQFIGAENKQGNITSEQYLWFLRW